MGKEKGFAGGAVTSLHVSPAVIGEGGSSVFVLLSDADGGSGGW
jgi:hypothetical protein